MRLLFFYCFFQISAAKVISAYYKPFKQIFHLCYIFAKHRRNMFDITSGSPLLQGFSTVCFVIKGKIRTFGLASPKACIYIYKKVKAYEKDF